MSSLPCRVSHAAAKLATRAQWNSLTKRSQTRTMGCASGCAVSVLASFGIGHRLQGFSVVGCVDLLASLVDGVDLVAPFFGLDLLDRETLGLEQIFELALRCKLGRVGGTARGVGSKRRSGDCDQG